MLKPRHVKDLAHPSALISSLLRDGLSIAFEAHGTSMLPTIRPGDKLLIRPAGFFVQPGDVILMQAPRGLTAHRVVRLDRRNQRTFVVTRGDNSRDEDAPVEISQILGRVVSLTRRGRVLSVDRRSWPRTLLWRFRRRIREIVARSLR